MRTDEDIIISHLGAPNVIEGINDFRGYLQDIPKSYLLRRKKELIADGTIKIDSISEILIELVILIRLFKTNQAEINRILKTCFIEDFINEMAWLEQKLRSFREMHPLTHQSIVSRFQEIIDTFRHLPSRANSSIDTNLSAQNPLQIPEKTSQRKNNYDLTASDCIQGAEALITFLHTHLSGDVKEVVKKYLAEFLHNVTAKGYVITAFIFGREHGINQHDKTRFISNDCIDVSRKQFVIIVVQNNGRAFSYLADLGSICGTAISVDSYAKTLHSAEELLQMVDPHRTAQWSRPSVEYFTLWANQPKGVGIIPLSSNCTCEAVMPSLVESQNKVGVRFNLKDGFLDVSTIEIMTIESAQLLINALQADQQTKTADKPKGLVSSSTVQSLEMVVGPDGNQYLLVNGSQYFAAANDPNISPSTQFTARLEAGLLPTLAQTMMQTGRGAINPAPSRNGMFGQQRTQKDDDDEQEVAFQRGVALVDYDKNELPMAGIFLYGNPGCGKTHVAKRIGEYATQKGLRVFMTSETTMHRDVEKFRSGKTTLLEEFDLIILDDMNGLRMMFERQLIMDMVINGFDATDQFSRACKKIIITSNFSYADFLKRNTGSVVYRNRVDNVEDPKFLSRFRSAIHPERSVFQFAGSDRRLRMGF